MQLKSESVLFCLEINTLLQLIDVLDVQLKKVDEEIKNWDIQKYPDPDSYGMFDLTDGLAGMGFVTCQWYLTSTYGWYKIDKPLALKLGPKHPSGLTIAEIINHAGNYWKHHDEWLTGKNKKDSERIIEAFAKLGIEREDDYPLTNLLVEINPKREMQFAPLIPLLEEWGKEISNRAK
jgi:hypothetical protein